MIKPLHGSSGLPLVGVCKQKKEHINDVTIEFQKSQCSLNITPIRQLFQGELPVALYPPAVSLMYMDLHLILKSVLLSVQIWPLITDHLKLHETTVSSINGFPRHYAPVSSSDPRPFGHQYDQAPMPTPRLREL